MRLIVPAARYAHTLAALAALATASPLVAQNPSILEHRLRPAIRLSAQPDTAFEILDRMRYYHVPAVSIAVIDDFRIVFAKGYGVTEFGGTTPADSTTLFLAGSISKPVFTTGLLALVEQGKLSLDEDVNRFLTSWHLPESKFTEHEKVTLRRLITHSAGLTVWGFPGYAAGAPVPTVPQILDGAPPANTPAVRNDTTPGARWLYSGGGFTIAQLTATDVAHEPFPALMQRLVLSRAGMRRSTYENPLPAARRAEAASGHESIDTPVPGRYHTYPEMAAAGLWTTPSDLARWAIALAHSYRGESGGVLSPAMARQMISQQVQVKPPYGTGHWGLGVAVNGDGDSLNFSHGGRDEGFVASVTMWPTLGRGLVVMTNGVNGAVMDEISRAFTETYRIPDRPRTEKHLVLLDAHALTPFAGRYARVAGHDTVTLDVTVDSRRGALAMYDPSQKRTIYLLPAGGDAFMNIDNGGEFAFERDGAGSVHALTARTGEGWRVALKK